MTWVKHQEKNHLCELPMMSYPVYEVLVETMGNLGMAYTGELPTKYQCSLGDVWQCDECDRYWRVVTEKGQFFFQNFTSSDYPTLPRM